MAVVVRLLSSMALIAVLFAMVLSAPARPVLGADAQAHRSHLSGPVASSAFYPEVRLRKLHLVRPDLIPYPIYYEIYC